MSLFRKMLALAFVCLASLSVAQVSDQIVAARVLGPRWRQISRSSGMIFSGTVLKIESQPVGKGTPLPLMLMTFRVDRAIAGVHSGEVLMVREWTGAWSMQRAMSQGERVLIFLYPPSRLGLTSPVGARLGQVRLDVRGEIGEVNPAHDFIHGPQVTSQLRQRITMAQLERAIRRARLTPRITRRDHARPTPGN